MKILLKADFELRAEAELIVDRHHENRLDTSTKFESPVITSLIECIMSLEITLRVGSIIQRIPIDVPNTRILNLIQLCLSKLQRLLETTRRHSV